MSIWAQDPVSPALHTVGLGALATAAMGLIGYLPLTLTCLAATVTIIAYTLTIIDHPRVKLWLTRRQQRKNAARIAALRARQKIAQAQIDMLERVNEAKAVGEAVVQHVVNEAKEQLKNQ